jgi:hypothetical protein
MQKKFRPFSTKKTLLKIHVAGLFEDVSTPLGGSLMPPTVNNPTLCCDAFSLEMTATYQLTLSLKRSFFPRKKIPLNMSALELLQFPKLCG